MDCNHSFYFSRLLPGKCNEFLSIQEVERFSDIQWLPLLAFFSSCFLRVSIARNSILILAILFLSLDTFIWNYVFGFGGSFLLDESNFSFKQRYSQLILYRSNFVFWYCILCWEVFERWFCCTGTNRSLLLIFIDGLLLYSCQTRHRFLPKRK